MRLGPKDFLLYTVPAVLWALAIFAFSSVPSEDLPKLAILSQDKLLHLTAYLGFGFLLERAFRHQRVFPRLARQSKLAAILCAAIYGMSDEFHQSFVPGRSMDPWDLLADVLGVVLAMVLLLAYGRFRERRSTVPPATR